MPSTAVCAPLRIAVAGLGRPGAYHVERIGLRDDFEIVAVHDRDPERARLAPPHAGRFHAHWESLLDDPAIDVVLLAAPPAGRSRLAVQALEAGKHVAVGLPLADTPHEADALLAAARHTGRVLAVLPHRRWDDDFRTALTALRSGQLGRLRSAKRLLWDYQVRAASEQAGALTDVGAPLLDQMLQFFDGPPRDVTARIVESDGKELGFTLTVGFENGAMGLIDVDLAAIAPLRTGWVLMGTDGAWQNFRRFTKTEDEEIYETPVEPPPTLWDETYSELARVVQQTAPGEVPPETMQARLVVELIVAARESSATGRTVRISPSPAVAEAE